MLTYASSRVERKSFYRKSELQTFLLISGSHIGAPKRCTNMASPYKALQRCVKRFGKYRKIPKIIPSMYKPSKYKPPKLVTQKNSPLNRPSKYKPSGGLYLEFALKYKVKQSNNGKFPSNYSASLIDFETQISLHI